MSTETHATGGKEGLEGKIEVFDSLSTSVREFPESHSYKTLESGLIAKATELYQKHKGADGILKFNGDEEVAKTFAKELFAFAADHVAKQYVQVKFTEEEIKKMRETKDPASGKSQYENFIVSLLGIDEEAYHNQLKTRGKIDPKEINTLVAPIYETHDRVDTSKRTAKDIKDNRDADGALGYLRQLKARFPKALERLGIPSTYASVEEVRGLIASAARAIPRDMPISLAHQSAYAGAGAHGGH